MFDIHKDKDGRVFLAGKLDASQAERARDFLDQVAESCVIDFKDLNYISSACLGVLIATQKRLDQEGHSLQIVNLNKHLRELFRVAGFDFIFDIQ